MNTSMSLAQVLLQKAHEHLMSAYGFLYLKQWTLPDGSRWQKIGITDDLRRRDAEQNILPVPCITLAWLQLDSMEEARAIERAFHDTLDIYRITNANNRELFSLTDDQIVSVLIAIQELGPHQASNSIVNCESDLFG